MATCSSIGHELVGYIGRKNLHYIFASNRSRLIDVANFCNGVVGLGEDDARPLKVNVRKHLEGLGCYSSALDCDLDGLVLAVQEFCGAPSFSMADLNVVRNTLRAEPPATSAACGSGKKRGLEKRQLVCSCPLQGHTTTRTTFFFKIILEMDRWFGARYIHIGSSFCHSRLIFVEFSLCANLDRLCGTFGILYPICTKWKYPKLFSGFENYFGNG